MSDFKLDSTGDLAIESNDFVIIDGDDAIVQHVKIRLRLFLGEWFLDQRIGVPYYERILVKNPDLNVIRTIFRQAITKTPGIASIEQFAIDFGNSSRQLSLTFRALKDDGAILDFSEAFIIDAPTEEDA